MKVTLISNTSEPLKSIAVANAIMKEKYPLDYVKNMSCSELKNYVDEIFKTELQGSLEFAHFTFLVEDVTRAFTHQLVRHRTMSFSQQSMRFFNASKSGFKMPTFDHDAYRSQVQGVVDIVFKAYSRLIENGCPVENARSILPTNTLTSISFSSTYRGILKMAEVRLCLQTQDEFREVMRKIKDEIEKIEPYLAYKLIPICKKIGKCPFKSIFDRECILEKTL